MLSSLKSAVTGYRAVKSVVETITHPIQAARSAVVQWVLSTAVKILLAGAKETAAEAAVQQALAKTGSYVCPPLSLPVPKMLYDKVPEWEEVVGAVQEAANDAMAAPLALLGLRPGEVAVQHDAENMALVFTLTLQLQNTSTGKPAFEHCLAAATTESPRELAEPSLETTKTA